MAKAAPIPPGPMFQIKVLNSEKVAAKLNGIGLRAASIKTIKNKLRKIAQDSTKKRFETKGGGTWAELAESTAARKEEDGLDPRIMFATKKLYNALTRGRGTASDPDTPFEIHFGTDVEYARYHQLGTSKMPQRILVKLDAAEKREVANVIEEWIAKGKR